jgi:hypothetical protein
MNVIVVSLLLVITFLYLVLDSVRRGKLETKYSILWIITCFVLGVLSIGDGLLTFIANLLNVLYPPSVLFLFGLLFSLIMIFDLTRRISQLNHKLVSLTQEFTILKEKYEKETKDKEGSKR